MSSVHVVEQGQDQAQGAQAGDYLVRPCGEGEMEVGKVGDGSVMWVGSLPADQLPTDDPTQLLVAVRGFESALIERGG